MRSPEYRRDCSLATNPLEEAELTSEYKQHQDSPQQDTKLVFCTVPLLLHRGAGEHSLLQERLHPTLLGHLGPCLGKCRHRGPPCERCWEEEDWLLSSHSQLTQHIPQELCKYTRLQGKDLMDKCLPAPTGTHACRDRDTLGSHILLSGHPGPTPETEQAGKWLRLCQMDLDTGCHHCLPRMISGH